MDPSRVQASRPTSVPPDTPQLDTEREITLKVAEFLKGKTTKELLHARLCLCTVQIAESAKDPADVVQFFRNLKQEVSCGPMEFQDFFQNLTQEVTDTTVKELEEREISYVWRVILFKSGYLKQNILEFLANKVGAMICGALPTHMASIIEAAVAEGEQKTSERIDTEYVNRFHYPYEREFYVFDLRQMAVADCVRDLLKEL